MKLRVRINKQTSRVKLEGEEPTLTELNVQIREILLPSHGLSPDTEFTLSLNGSDLLSDSGQTLSSCGIVTGDLVCVILPPSVAVPFAAPAPSARQAVPSGSPASSAAFASSAHQSPSNSSSSSSSSPGLYQAVHPPAQRSSEASTSKGAEPQQEVVREEEEEQEEEAGQWVWEPMLCGEAEGGKVPHSLEVLYHQAQSSSTCDALMVAVHLLMLETGFLCQVSLYRRRGGGGTDRQTISIEYNSHSSLLPSSKPIGGEGQVGGTSGFLIQWV
ncbi:F-box only protein 7-like isoform X2 [Oncorhynchus keta]|nr:F-box only protein 7-like isoform X2 [Oncorhynchus keta]